jgi:hypothetical protein
MMKGKLIKTNSEDYHMGNYFLNNTEGFAIGSTDYEWCRRVSKPQYKLSKQNCEDCLSDDIQCDVEIVMDKIPADLAPGGWDVFPKLDAQECLILKKVL